MALGVKKITESVIEEKRALVTIGDYIPDQDILNVNDNNAIDAGGLFSGVIAEGGILRIKTGLNQQERIDADKSLGINSLTTRIIQDNAVSSAKLQDLAVTTNKIADKAVTTAKLADRSITSIKIDKFAVLNEHLNSEIADDSQRSVRHYNIMNSSIKTEKIQNNAVTFDKLSKDLQDRIKNIESSITNLTNKLNDLKTRVDDLEVDIESLRQLINNEISRLEKQIENLEKVIENNIGDITKIIEKQLGNVVLHNGSKSVGKSHGGTELINLHCTGDIQGNRVYYMTYQDLAEAYIPGEHLEPGDIVAMREDGKVYRADAFDQCIVGVISDEFANCLGATVNEIESGSKVAVGTVGKVHVNVRGPVKLGQQIHVIGADVGIGNASWTTVNSIGKSLETIDCGLNEINKVLVQIRPM